MSLTALNTTSRRHSRQNLWLQLRRMKGLMNSPRHKVQQRDIWLSFTSRRRLSTWVETSSISYWLPFRCKILLTRLKRKVKPGFFYSTFLKNSKLFLINSDTFLLCRYLFNLFVSIFLIFISSKSFKTSA